MHQRGDALVEVRVRKTCRYIPGQIIAEAAATLRPRFRTDTARAVPCAAATGLHARARTIPADSNRCHGGGRPRRSLTITNTRSAAGAAGLADPALDLRDAHAGPRIGQHAGVKCERPDDHGRRRAVQYRDRSKAVLPHHDVALLDRATGSEPAALSRRRMHASSRISVGTTAARISR